MENDLAYIAGFLDGEGTITIKFRKTRNKSSWSKYHQAEVGIANNSLEILMWIKEFLRRELGIRSNLSGTSNVCFRLGFTSRQAIRISEVLYPYLRLKKSQAFVLLEFGKMMYANRKTLHDVQGRIMGREPISEEEVLNRNELTRKIRLLNGRFSRNARPDFEPPKFIDHNN